MPAVGAVLADPAQPGFGVFNTVNLTSQGDRTVSITPLFVLDPPPAPPVFPPKAPPTPPGIPPCLRRRRPRRRHRHRHRPFRGC